MDLQFISLEFVAFFVAFLFLYYHLQNQYRIPLLLLANILFAYLSGGWITLVSLFFSIVSTWYGALLIEKLYRQEQKKAVLICVVVMNVVVLGAMKYLDFFISTGNTVASIFHMPARIPEISVPSAVGVSFYTLQLLGYLIDVYWETISAEHNFLVYAVFGSYFPQLLSGPISSWEALGVKMGGFYGSSKELHRKTGADLECITKGLQRVLWGVFKKLVIAERLAYIVAGVYSSPQNYSGFGVVLATIGFTVQLYTDFSGYTDIVLGISQLLGIGLPENFRAPFSSKNISEFWRRWHITLGAWMKRYIFYPMLRSGSIGKIREWTYANFGKKAAKKVPTFIALLILWCFMGLWHGGAWKFIIGSGLLQAVYMIGGELLHPLFQKLTLFFRLDTAAFSYKLFLQVRTFALICISLCFFRAESMLAALKMLNKILTFTDYHFHDLSTMIGLLSGHSFIILCFALLILFVHDVMEGCYLQRGLNGQEVREWFNKQNYVFRMLYYWVVVSMIVLSFGMSTSEYIYMRF